MPASTTKPPAPTAAAAAPTRRSRSRSPPPTPPAVSAQPPLRSMSGLPADLAHLLETKDLADVEFEVGGKVFPAHKLVLAARSPVFRAVFFGAAKEKATGYVRICDMHPDAFEALLHYLYTDSLPPAVLVPVTSGGGGAREEEAAVVLAQDLLVAADRYGLRDLKSLTETELCRHDVGVATVLPMLALAEHHQCWKLKNKCLEFVASGANARAVMETDDLEHLARTCPSVVREIVVKILEAKDKEATPSRPPTAKPRAKEAAVLFFFLALAWILPLGIWILHYWGYLQPK